MRPEITHISESRRFEQFAEFKTALIYLKRFKLGMNSDSPSGLVVKRRTRTMYVRHAKIFSSILKGGNVSFNICFLLAFVYITCLEKRSLLSHCFIDG